MIHHIVSWSIFVVFGGIMGSMRYFGGFSAGDVEIIGQIGPVIVMIIHFTIVVIAFKDSLFNGLLSLLVPFYSFYYLFIIEGNYYVRAIIGGLLIGIGQDSFVIIYQNIINMFSGSYDFFTSGGKGY